MPEPMYSWLQQAIDEGAHVVTASRRLARELRKVYDEQRVSAGCDAWLTPPIRSWNDWLNRQFSAVENSAVFPTRLGPLASSILMERSLRRYLPDGLPGIGGIVRQAGQSWQRIREWQVPLADLESSARSQDEIAFAKAALDYSRQLEAGRWVDNAGMSGLIAELISGNRIPVPKKLVLAGFDRLSPATNGVVAALEKAGVTVVVAASADETSASNDLKLSVRSFDNLESELRTAGAWARAQLETDPRAKIAIVSPVLENNASQVTRLIREGLVPGWQYGGVTFAAAANVSYGRKLAEYPAIAIALLLLRWVHQGVSSRELSLLLRSRCVGGELTDGRSRIELAMRRHSDRTWSVEEFRRVFRDVDESPDSLAFMDSAAELAKLGLDQREQAAPSGWAERIDAALTAAHWPGDAVLDSSEFQLVNRWRELLNEFAAIEMVMPRLGLSDACQRLSALASETLYQPESGRGLVQVLGSLEAAGLEFDRLWISGLDGSQWPPPSRPALFLSNALQRRYGMPDATPGDTLEFSRRVFKRLTSAADACELSWSMNRDDLELTASSLVDAFSTDQTAGSEDPGWYATTLTGFAEFDVLTDDAAPPVAADEHIRGGAYTIQRHFVEPFAAFVHGRLGVRIPEPIAPGLSPSVRGNIIHNALHNLLAGKPTQSEIIAWTAENLEQRIGSAIDAALSEHGLNADKVMRRIIAIERTRLRQLLYDFVEAEAARPEFAVIDVEKSIDYASFGIRLGLRIDRIDKMANGRLLLIDYKTGLPKSLLGQSGEPTDLQLIVYADALNAEIGGLALINVDSRVITYKGAGGEGGPWKATDDDEWDATLAAWQSQVHVALQEISAGDVRINLLQSVSEARPLNILSRKEEQKRAD